MNEPFERRVNGARRKEDGYMGKVCTLRESLILLGFLVLLLYLFLTSITAATEHAEKPFKKLHTLPLTTSKMYL